MAVLDPTRNLTTVVVSTGYNATATSITLQTGDGALLPDTATEGGFELTWYNSTDYSSNPAVDPNVEIIFVSSRTGDTLTVVRAQGGTSASTKNTALKSYAMLLGINKKFRDDIDTALTTATTHIADTSDPHGATLTQTNINLTGKIYLDGGGDTYIHEGAANRIDFRTGGGDSVFIQTDRIGTQRVTAHPVMMIEASTSTNPVHAFYADEDTGLGRAAANELSLITGGVEAIRIDSSQNVNIQSSLLEVGVSSVGGHKMMVTNTDTGISWADVTAKADSGEMHMYAFSSGYSTYGGFMADAGVLYADPSLSGGLSIMADAVASIRFYTNDVTVIDTEIDSNGYISFQGSVKTTTGNPGSPRNGMLQINEFDNAIKMYADGAWRTLVSW